MSDAINNDAARLRALGDLLRARRAALTPADVGLPDGAPRRRTAGLRREEVAQLAAISPTYYAFLEQGRDVRPSRQVLDALAGALRLDDAERAHLHALVHDAAPAAGAGDAAQEEERLDPEVAALVARLDPHPAYVSGRRWDVLASNRAARLLWTDWTALPADDRNMVWFMLGDPRSRDVFVEWEAEARAQLARFRAAAERHAGDPGFAALIDRLHAASPEARSWWEGHAIAPLGGGRKRLRHPVLGELLLHHTVLTVAGAPEQKLVSFRLSPGDAERVAALLP
ncbi:helix-turn-helix transcriptional regulator [Conexibacter woesei]|uniref:helix-turn-helix transcriptional regulator n=1 Tax=Conexibacter woesei TaxID=191495 RepID=UPI0004218D58|nr:helix-turn-helix transcriptional regulator [Conexibacter woesei]